VLGVGGMGVVVAAHHIVLATKVVIKFLLPSWAIATPWPGSSVRLAPQCASRANT